MRSIFTLAALVLVLAIVGLLVKKQLGTSRAPAPAASQAAADAGLALPAGTSAQPGQPIPQQVQQQMDQLMQQRRP
ncbi:MAG: hypothetical protein LWW82_02210, partial [Comamonadaceae bacterium]|nr:hypothetical protein [Comamonadaceae bacterium]